MRARVMKDDKERGDRAKAVEPGKYRVARQSS
jgi:hypothetical protein